MYFRTDTVKRSDKEYHYLRLVESYRDKKGKVAHRVVKNFGNIENLSIKRLLGLIKSLLRHVRLPIIFNDEKLETYTYDAGDIALIRYAFNQLRLPEILAKYLKSEKRRYDVVEAIFRMIAQRLTDPGCKLDLLLWQKRLRTSEKISYHHYLRAMDALVLKKEAIEKEMYLSQLELFSSDVDLVFYDTTSSYFEGAMQRSDLARYGKSKDQREDRKQVVLGIILGKDDLVIGHKVFPGNTADVTTLRSVIGELKDKYRIKRFVIVIDRGMVSEGNLAEIEGVGEEYIVALKKRNLLESKEILKELEKEEWQELKENLRIKMVKKEKYWYVLGYNPYMAEKDKERREENRKKIEARLEKLSNLIKAGRLKEPQKIIRKIEQIIGKYRIGRCINYWVKEGDFGYDWDSGRWLNEESADGRFLLKSNALSLSAEDVIFGYKSLQDVEFAFRELKSPLRLRPLHHWTDERIKAHIFICVLAFTIGKVIGKLLKNKFKNVAKLLSNLNRIKLVRLKAERVELETLANWDKVSIEIFKMLKLKEKEIIDLLK